MSVTERLSSRSDIHATLRLDFIVCVKVTRNDVNVMGLCSERLIDEGILYGMFDMKLCFKRS